MTEMAIEATSDAKPGIKHWLFQIVPPCMMLAILFSTRNGAALVYLAGIFILPVLFSLVSIIAKLIFFKKRKYYLLRPALTIFMFLVILNVAHWAYSVALEQATNAADKIHTRCNADSVCPQNPDGWKVDGKRIKRKFGSWLEYTASYHYSDYSFDIRVYQGPDLGHNITGGVDSDLEVKPYVDG